MSSRITILTVIILIVINYSLFAQKIINPEPVYDPVIISPMYQIDKGPVIHLDEGHYNRHTYGGLGSFIAFKDVLIQDAYRIASFKDQFSVKNLKEIRILVISLAQNKKNLEPRWFNPVYSAFKRSEIVALKHWVNNGGALFLIVDHHPFAGASKDLAKAFGFDLYNGHAENEQDLFIRANGTLHSNIITNGKDISEMVDSIKTFAGAAMKLKRGALPILTFDGDWQHYLPDTAWNYTNVEPKSLEGLSQGGYNEIGKGKIVVFGDGNMFSAQIDDDGEIAGFIDPNAKYNSQLLLNIIHYLDGQ